MNAEIDFSLKEIKDYILRQLKENEEIFFFNELELQIFVARILENALKKDCKVHLEYQLPKGWNEKFDKGYERWGTEKPYFDIVIEHENQFIVIELKYKLKKIKLNKENQFLRFGEKAKDENLVLVTNQSAENEGRYDFWKDVKRIEVLRTAFEKVIGGIALFVTNQSSYIEQGQQNTKGEKQEKKMYKYSNFAFGKEKKGFLFWNPDDDSQITEEFPNGERLKKNKYGKFYSGEKWEHWVRPNFTLEEEYRELMWEKIGTPLNEEFYCYSVVVPS